MRSAGEDQDQPASHRQVSLDVLRGLVIALLVLVEWLPGRPDVYAGLRHSPWDGVRVADFVFPGFLFMVGASMAVAGWRRPAPVLRLVRRAMVLVLLGLFFNAWGTTGADLSHLRVTGVLQMIGVAGLLAGLVTRFLRPTWAVAAVAGAVLALHGFLLSLVTTDCGRGVLERGCSSAWRSDRVLGLDHLYRMGTAGHDPEGVMTTVLGATGLVLLGWVAAHVVYRSSWLFRLVLPAALGIVTLLAVLVWDPNKRLWTPSFTVLMALTFTVLLLVLALALDRRSFLPVRVAQWPLIALGRNALLVYIGQHLVLTSLRLTPSGESNLADELLLDIGGWASGDQALLYFALVGVVAWTVVAGVLHQLRWYFTV